ncbi:protein of unknown function [Taphrina deformans PYCC 5710]|uniref:Uncharacterized protein n=1 Tax=Taphrina deformans (strain PYCC 5710 / ATCC 11124 / CBS 356.35 / IMI 108563 / JCM 9778 / NBRC 8474) TaxID=1097556 RepID=R4XH19_TAPDE|nr:protein of unknown function [Taphrina deformans PYCC 5710]|eukprot:CCG85091.1 protein of unknown function [Taphrina deformans PYCC 5710]
MKDYFKLVIKTYNERGALGIEALMKHKDYNVMFRKDNKPSSKEIEQGVKRFFKKEPVLPNNVHIDQMLEYLFGAAWQAKSREYHEETGNLVITPDVQRDHSSCSVDDVLKHPSMEYLLLPLARLGLYDDCFGDCKTLRDLCKQEAAMYLYHQKPDNNKPNYGWNRLQYYSIGQVLARADPAHYVASVALRPDALASPHLISWPYYVRYATTLEKTEFYHLDIDVEQAVQHGEYLSTVQSSVSLSNENEGCCVVLVPGFHKSFSKWYEHIRDNGQLKSGFGCCRISPKTYGATEQGLFGKWESCPCPMGSIRFSKPEIVHGSSGSGGKSSMMPGLQPTTLTEPRLNYLPWMARVDVVSGEIEYGHHRHLKLADLRQDVLESRVPQWTLGNVSGRKYTVVHQMVVNLRTTAPTALGRAITCEGKWSDPEAQETLERLISPSVHTIAETVQEERMINIKWAVDRFLKLRLVEKREYNGNSFFKIIEDGEVPVPATVVATQDLITGAQGFVASHST